MNREEFQDLVARKPAARKYLIWHRPTEKRREYWRLKWKDRPTVAQLKARLLFLETSFGSYGSRGFVLYNGLKIPSSAAAVAKKMKGKKFSEGNRRLEKTSVLLEKVMEKEDLTSSERLEKLKNALEPIARELNRRRKARAIIYA